MKRRCGNKRKLVLGLTGSFGSGKTTVAKILKSLGAEIIDADKLARGCIVPKSAAYKKIIRVFGQSVLKGGGSIDRGKLADIVFGNFECLLKLNSIIHPEVIRIIKNRINSFKSGLIVLDAPLLIEAGLKGLVDKLIVVNISRDEQVKRIKKRMSLSEQDIHKRIRAQISLSRKIRLADFVIDNNGGREETRRQAKRIWKSLACRCQGRV